MEKSIVCALCVLVGTLTASVACAQSKTADVTALHKELEALRKSQESMARDVADIKKILESLQGPPPVGPAEGRVDTLGAPERGNARATVAIVEFSDYQCPFCKRHVDATLPLIEKNYVTSGKVRYVFMDYPLEAIHPLAFKAAEASHCAAEQKQFWKMHDRLFANQDKLKPDQLMAHATALGLDSARFGTCLASGKYAARIKASLAQGEKFGISGTPAIVLGRNRNGSIEAARLIVGALPFEVIKEEVDKLLAESPKAK
jgi:protein-disulfide isomerase